MQAKKGILYFDNGIELNLKTGETTEHFFFMPEEKEKFDRGNFPSREIVMLLLKRNGIFAY